LVFLREAQRHGRRGSFAFSGLFMGMGLLTKIAMFFPFVPVWAMGSVFAYRSAVRSGDKIRSSLAFHLPVVISLCIWAVFAKHAFGSFFSTGYSHSVTALSSQVWRTSFLEGIFQQLFSWDFGLLFYSPILVVPTAYALWKLRHKRIDSFDICVGLCIGIQICLYAKWYSPHGGESLGPRYLVTVVPAFLLLLRGIHWPRQSTLVWPVVLPVALLIVLSTAIQWVNVSVKVQHYWIFKQYKGAQVTTPHWIANMKIFWHKLQQKDEVYSLSEFGSPLKKEIDLRGAESLSGFNFWWLHLYRSSNPTNKSPPKPKSIG